MRLLREVPRSVNCG